MNRTLTFADSAGHPLRRALISPQAMPSARSDDRDWKLFVLSFTAFFICFYTFIA
jgi:hypothetical protein